MYKIKVYVTLRESVLDPQGNAAKDALQNMGKTTVNDVRIGKYIELTLEKPTENIDEVIKEMCENLLVNTIMEDYRYEIEECVSQ